MHGSDGVAYIWKGVDGYKPSVSSCLMLLSLPFVQLTPSQLWNSSSNKCVARYIPRGLFKKNKGQFIIEPDMEGMTNLILLTYLIIAQIKAHRNTMGRVPARMREESLDSDTSVLLK